MSAATLRPMVPADLPAGQRLSASFAWPHRVEDWALMLELGEGIVAELDGAVAGTAMAWRYGDDAATVGMIIVAEPLHGRGMGRLMLQTLLDRLEGRSVSLNATPEGLKLYHALGFAPGAEVTKFQVDRLAAAGEASAARALTQADLQWMTALDRQATGLQRERLIGALLAAGSGVAVGRDGFALTRRFGKGHLIGPVIAPNGAAARVLVGALLGPLEGQLVRIDLTEGADLGPWLTERGFKSTAPVLGMTSGAPPPRAGTLFALASQAYG